MRFFFYCKNAAGFCFLAEVAHGHIYLRIGCADKKSNRSSQNQPLKSTISSRGKGRAQETFDFDEVVDVSNIRFLKGNEGLYGVNVELNCLSASTETHTTPSLNIYPEGQKRTEPSAECCIDMWAWFGGLLLVTMSWFVHLKHKHKR